MSSCSFGEELEEDNVMAMLRSHHHPPEMGFFHLLKNAMLAINLLPTNCSAG